MGREDVMLAAKDDPSQLEGVAAVDVRGNFMFDAATHRDVGQWCTFMAVGRATKGGGRGLLHNNVPCIQRILNSQQPATH